MSVLIQINVTNNSPFAQNFITFQQPGIYSGGASVYSNSLQSATVLPYAHSGHVHTILMECDYFAAVQQQVRPPMVGQLSGFSAAVQRVEPTPAGGGPARNSASMTVVPALGLSPAAHTPSVQQGAFRIAAPAFNPIVTPYNAGSAVMLASGQVVLSSFQEVHPSTNLDCQPVMQFHVALGSQEAGTVINFGDAVANAALCDATGGVTTFNVSYNADGSWTVMPGASTLTSSEDDRGRRSVHRIARHAGIRNDGEAAAAGRSQAVSLHAPFAVERLAMPGMGRRY